MAKAGYSARTTGATGVALTVGTARTVLMVITPSSFAGDLQSVSVGFDSVTATDKPVFIELCRCTNATNSTPGTNNTSETSNIQQVYGPSVTVGFTAGSAWTAGNEPTTLTVIRSWTLSPIGTTAFIDLPLGRTVDWPVSSGIALRMTAPTNAVNAWAEMIFERA